MIADDPQQIVILGAGFIGVSFAACFLDAGWRVTLSDPDAGGRHDAPAGLAAQKQAIELAGLLHGNVLPADSASIFALIKAFPFNGLKGFFSIKGDENSDALIIFLIYFFDKSF